MESSESAINEVTAHSQSSLALLNPLEGCHFETKIGSPDELMQYICKKSVRSKLLVTVTIGMPNSGTSTLLQEMIKCSDRSAYKGLHMYYAVLFKNSIKDEGHFVVFNTPKEMADAMFLYCFTKLLVTKHLTLPKDFVKSKWPTFSNSEARDHFSILSCKLCTMMQDLSITQQVTLTKLQSYINFCDININKAVNEFAYLIAQKCKRGLLVFAIDLIFYTIDRLTECFDLTNEYYKAKYREEEVQFLKTYPAIRYFIDTLEALFISSNSENKIIVAGIHDDTLKDDVITKLKLYLNAIRHEILASKIDIIEVKRITASDSVKMKFDEKNIITMRKELIHRVQDNFGDNHYVKLKFMFLYSILQNTKQMFLTKTEVLKFCSDCNIDECELNDFFELFQDSCFLLVIADYIILNVQKFFEGIEKIYYLSKDNQAIEVVQSGKISYSACENLWEDFESNSEVCPFYISIFVTVGLAVELQSFSDDMKSKMYYMPSIRCEDYTKNVSKDSSSLIIKFHNTFMPRHMQCKLVASFQDKGSNFKLLESTFSNVTKISLTENASTLEITFIFFPKYIEVQCSMDATSTEDTTVKAYGFIKSTCIQVFNKIREEDIPSMQYTLAIVCPMSDAKKPHAAYFMEASTPKSFKCRHCERTKVSPEVDQSSSTRELLSEQIWNTERFIWVKSAHVGQTIHKMDILTERVLHEIVPLFKGEDETALASILNVCLDDIKILKAWTEKEERIFCILYQWIINKGKIASKYDLAGDLLTQNSPFNCIAYKLCPMLYNGHSYLTSLDSQAE